MEQGQSSQILIQSGGSQPVIHDLRHFAHFFFFKENVFQEVYAYTEFPWTMFK